jgi:hypothetical protein
MSGCTHRRNQRNGQQEKSHGFPPCSWRELVEVRAGAAINRYRRKDAAAALNSE